MSEPRPGHDDRPADPASATTTDLNPDPDAMDAGAHVGPPGDVGGDPREDCVSDDQLSTGDGSTGDGSTGDGSTDDGSTEGVREDGVSDVKASDDDGTSTDDGTPAEADTGRFGAVTRTLDRLPHPVRVVGVAVIGGVLVLAGLAMLVLPGPGIVVILAGLAVLASEFVWARRILERTKAAAKAGLDKGKAVVKRSS